MTASAIIVSKNNITYHPFNEKCHYNQITSVSSTPCVSQQNESHPHYQTRNEKSSSLCIMPYIYDFSDNMTAMTNGISSTSGGAPIIEISKSPSKNDKNQNHNQHAQGVYREKDPNQNSARGLKRYKILSLIGDGTYGLVYLATNVETGEKVAIKSMKRRYHSWDEVTDLREVKSLKKLHHPNVVKLKEVIRENSRLYFIFEYVRGDLLGLMREKPNEHFPEFWIRSVIQQVLQGLSYMHRLGFFHRDLKPENILATTGGADVLVKIADFGLAREIRSAPPFTDYVSTRWYRAPEVLLRSTNYNSPIDIWAVGCITSELYTKRPLFPGTSEIDQLYKIASILGTPGRNDWPDGYGLAGNMHFKFPTFKSTHLAQVLGPRSSARAVSFLYALLTWNPSWRSCAQEALRHSYFRMGKPSSNSQNNSDTSSSINSISSKISGIATNEILETTPKLSLKLRPKALIPSDQHSNHSTMQNNNRATDGYTSSYQPLSQADNNHTISYNKKDISPHHNSDASRIPLPMTEIEPSWSRDSKTNPNEKKLPPEREKPIVDAAMKQKVIDNLDFRREFDFEDEGIAAGNDEVDDDFADLISAISLGGGGNFASNFDTLDLSPKTLKSFSTPTKNRSRTKKNGHGSKPRNNPRRNSKGIVEYSVYGGGEGLIQINSMKHASNNISDRLSNLSSMEMNGDSENPTTSNLSPIMHQSSRRFSIHQRKGKDVKACLSNQTYSDLGGIAITSTTEDISLLDQLRNLRINGFRSSNINCIKVVTPYMTKPSNKFLFQNHLKPNESPKSNGGKVHFSMSPGSTYQPQFGNGSPNRKMKQNQNKLNGSIPKNLMFSPKNINKYKEKALQQSLANISPFRSLPDFNVTVSGVGAGRPEKLSKQDRVQHQMNENIIRSKKRLNQQEREDELNSMMNGEAGLVVEKIGANGYENGMAQSSNNHHQQNQRDMSQKKSVHVRTDWAAKYLK